MYVDLNQLLVKTTVYVDIWSKMFYLLKYMEYDNMCQLALASSFMHFIFLKHKRV